MSVYANAADVLPSELLKAVQKHWRGLLYIPPVNYKSKADKNFVQNMVASGTPIGEVAEMCIRDRCCPRAVTQKITQF